MLKVVSKKFVLIVISFAIILLFFLYLQEKEVKVATKIDKVANIHCPLQSQSCLINLSSNVKLNVSLSPKGLPAMEPLTLTLESDQIDFQDITQFEAVFKGRDMEMGSHSLNASSVESPRVLVAKGLIPLCPMDSQMVWELNIKFNYQGKVTLLKFEVSSDVSLSAASSH